MESKRPRSWIDAVREMLEQETIDYYARGPDVRGRGASNQVGWVGKQYRDLEVPPAGSGGGWERSPMVIESPGRSGGGVDRLALLRKFLLGR